MEKYSPIQSRFKKNLNIITPLLFPHAFLFWWLSLILEMLFWVAVVSRSKKPCVHCILLHFSPQDTEVAIPHSRCTDSPATQGRREVCITFNKMFFLSPILRNAVWFKVHSHFPLHAIFLKLESWRSLVTWV